MDLTTSTAAELVARAFPHFAPGGVRAGLMTRLLELALPSARHGPGRELAEDGPRRAFYTECVGSSARALAAMAPGEELRRALAGEIRRDMDQFLLEYADAVAAALARRAPGRPTGGGVEVVSVGCGAGWKERILSGRVATRLSESTETAELPVRWIGIDKEDPDSEALVEMFRVGRNYFWADACTADDYLAAARARPGAIVIASYLVHHLPLAPDAFLDKCAGAEAVILLEELIGEEDALDHRHLLARVGYELLANFAFFPAIVERVLPDPGRFWLRYWTEAEVTRHGGRAHRIAGVSPRTDVVIFDNPGRARHEGWSALSSLPPAADRAHPPSAPRKDDAP